MINPKQLATEVALIIFGGYALYSIFYMILDVTISLMIFLFTGNFKSFLTDSFFEASMMCPLFPFCILEWQLKTPMLGLNSILNSILSAQYSFWGRVGSAAISISIFVLMMVVYLKQNFEIIVKPSRLQNIIYLAAILAVTALFIPTMVAFTGGFIIRSLKILGWS